MFFNNKMTPILVTLSNSLINGVGEVHERITHNYLANPLIYSQMKY